VERSSTFTTPEIVGIAAAAATALGGVIVALGRSQSNGHATRPELTQTASLGALGTATTQQLERGKSVAKSAKSYLGSAYPEILHTAGEVLTKASETAKPQATRAVSAATSRAEQARATGGSMLERLQESIGPATHAIDAVRDQAAVARERARPVASSIVTTGATKADVAATKSTNAAREMVALVAWLSLAASLVYLVILDDERRERVKNALFGAFEQAQLLLQDFQGYEEDI
jgi:hypothetical protein